MLNYCIVFRTFRTDWGPATSLRQTIMIKKLHINSFNTQITTIIPVCRWIWNFHEHTTASTFLRNLNVKLSRKCSARFHCGHIGSKKWTLRTFFHYRHTLTLRIKVGPINYFALGCLVDVLLSPSWYIIYKDAILVLFIRMGTEDNKYFGCSLCLKFYRSL